jgi:hypothetical protein
MIPASTVAMFLVLEPVFTDVLSWATGGGSMDTWEYMGAALTCAGLVVVLLAGEPFAKLEHSEKGGSCDDADFSKEKQAPSENSPLLRPPPICEAS